MLQKQGKSASFRSQILFSFISSRTWKANCIVIWRHLTPNTYYPDFFSFVQSDWNAWKKNKVSLKTRVCSPDHIIAGAVSLVASIHCQLVKIVLKKSCDKIERLDQWTTRSYIADWLKFLLIFKCGLSRTPAPARGRFSLCTNWFNIESEKTWFRVKLIHFSLMAGVRVMLTQHLCCLEA